MKSAIILLLTTIRNFNSLTHQIIIIKKIEIIMKDPTNHDIILRSTVATGH